MSSRTQRVSPGILVFPTHAGPKMPRRFSEIYGDLRRFSEILAPAPNVPKTLTGAANLNQAHGDFGAVPFGLIKLLREYGTPLALASPGALPPGPTAGSSPGSSITTQGSHRETGLVRSQHQNFTGSPSAKRDLRRSLRRRPWRGVWGPLGRANFRSGAAPNVIYRACGKSAWRMALLPWSLASESYRNERTGETLLCHLFEQGPEVSLPDGCPCPFNPATLAPWTTIVNCASELLYRCCVICFIRGPR